MDVYKEIEDAELVLVGIGEEFDIGMAELEMSAIYKSFTNKISSEGLIEEQYAWMYPLMLCHALNEDGFALRQKHAYRKLADMLKNKNYFVVSMNMDSLAASCGIKADKLVQPFGSYLKLQCDDDCSGKLYSAVNYIQGVCNLIQDPQVRLSNILQEVCDDCGGHLVSNTVNCRAYNEKGYLPQWDVYQKWLMGTVNKKLLILELGVCGSYPSIIKKPFEKMGTYNKKSSFLRINLKDSLVPDELSGRGTGIKENAVEFINRI